jgi:hypothetical protein
MGILDKCHGRDEGPHSSGVFFMRHVTEGLFTGFGEKVTGFMPGIPKVHAIPVQRSSAFGSTVAGLTADCSPGGLIDCIAVPVPCFCDVAVGI